MSAVSSTARIYYVNGVDNTSRTTQAYARRLHHLADHVPCYGFFNDATPSDRIRHYKMAGIATAVGALASAALALIFPPAGIAATAAVGVTAGVTTRNEIENVQDIKEDAARELAEDIKNFLRINPHHHVVLVGHSQGTHVVDLALGLLQNYRDRISVIGIGGLVSICASKAARVSQFVNQGDRVASSYAQTYLSHVLVNRAPHLITDCNRRERPTTRHTRHLGHSANDYLDNPDFVSTLKKFVRVSPSDERAQRVQRAAARARPIQLPQPTVSATPQRSYLEQLAAQTRVAQVQRQQPRNGVQPHDQSAAQYARNGFPRSVSRPMQVQGA